ncbi:MAG: TRAP transporter substrate-binding protein [Spirochaetales bacterium]|jgi:tripartite ATP-independent transporter DctP family solute receptor|nr:TRAP transporter substrate-binding protein [Spirochaetales bacterium]
MQKKRFLFIALALLIASLVYAGGGSEGGAESKMVFRLANSHNPEHVTSQACQRFADSVKQKTNGRIEIQTFFASQLGDERSTVLQCQLGGLDFTRVSSGASAEFAPLMNALQMPYEYENTDHLFRVLDGEIGKAVFETFKQNNLVGIVYIHPGSRNFFNSKREIRTPADMKGLKIRVSESQVMIELMKALGAIAVPLPFNDTYSAVQTGVCDGAENNMTSYIEMSFDEVAKYWTYDNHSFMPDMLLASKIVWDKIPSADQALILECAEEASKWHRNEWEASEAKNAKIALDRGRILTTLKPEELAQFQKAVEPMYKTLLNSEQQAIVKQVQALAK